MNAGMFEILKKEMVQTLDQTYNVKINQQKQPKVDTYGSKKAEIKYQIYLMFKNQDTIFETKVDLFNTPCTVGIDSIGDGAER